MPEERTALVVEDDEDIRQILVTVLRQAGLAVEAASRGSEGLERARELLPDLVTLDISLPDMDGIEVCRELRTFSDAYVIIVSASGDEIDRLIGLETGADDYLTKPFSPRELRARVAAMFRRPRSGSGPDQESAEGVGGDVLSFGDLTLDLGAREVRLVGSDVDLTRIEFDLLAELMGDPRRVFERATLMRRVWKSDWLGDDHLVDVHMANLRKKLGDDPKDGRIIRTVRGVGYRLGSG